MRSRNLAKLTFLPEDGAVIISKNQFNAFRFYFSSIRKKFVNVTKKISLYQFVHPALHSIHLNVCISDKENKKKFKSVSVGAWEMKEMVF